VSATTTDRGFAGDPELIDGLFSDMAGASPAADCVG
jgi:hypothetical protein